MIVRSALLAAILVARRPSPASPQAAPCAATRTSLTPASWTAPAANLARTPTPTLTLVREIPLPGSANRFDYQSVDPSTGRIYMNHMNAGRTIVFDADSGRVLTEIMDVRRATGVRLVGPHHQVYISAAGSHEVAIVDDRSLKVIGRVGGI